MTGWRLARWATICGLLGVCVVGIAVASCHGERTAGPGDPSCAAPRVGAPSCAVGRRLEQTTKNVYGTARFGNRWDVEYWCSSPDGVEDGGYWYYEGEALVVSGSFERGQRVGRWITWAADGAVAGVEVFDQGAVVRRHTCVKGAEWRSVAAGSLTLAIARGRAP